SAMLCPRCEGWRLTLDIYLVGRSMPRLYKETRAVLNKFLTVDLGLLGYRQAYALQKRVVAARKAGAIEDVLLLCEHAHVITLGRNGKLENLLASEHVLRQKGVEFDATD